MTLADVLVNRSGLATYTLGPQDRSILSLSGSSQQLMPANPNRRSFNIQNTGTADIVVTFVAATAAANSLGCYEIPPSAMLSAEMLGGQVPKGACQIIGTAGQPVTADETYGYPRRV